MMKKLVLLLLSLTLLLSAAGLATAEETTLPRVGDEVSGFVVKSITPMDVLGSIGVLFEHTKTGAELLYLANEDINRSFEIAFRTPALDNKGKPHVFEHMTICGSQKYPDPNLFFPFSNQTYNTYVNAWTYASTTMYPLASLSEEQLLTMMDYYLSGVFSPLMYTEPRMVQREAWRYELTDVDAPLTVAGTVYSEMQGALDISSLAYLNNKISLYEGSPVAHESGGLPEDIRTLTYDELVEFHDTYYHPSNALIILYGDLDYENYLTFIDTEYLSKYDKKDIYVERGKVEPYAETRYFTYDAPVEETAQTEDASYIYYSFALSDGGMEDYIKLNLLSNVLSSESSPLMRIMREQLPNANVNISAEIDQPTVSLSFTAYGINESDRDVFEKAVDDSIAALAENGITSEELDAVLSAFKLSILLTPEDADLGVSASREIALFWANFDRTDYFAAIEKVLDEVDAAALNEMVKTALVDNAYRSVSVTRPVAGLAEENAARLEEELSQYKASLSQEELETLVQDTKDYLEWSTKPASADLLNQLVSTTVAELPEEIVQYEITDETKDGIRYVSAEAPVNDVIQTKLFLDAATLPIDQIQDVRLYLELLGKLDTAQYGKEELAVLLSRYLNDFQSGMTVGTAFDSEHDDVYFMTLGWIGLGEDVDQSVALLREILQNTQLTDVSTMRNIIARLRNEIGLSMQTDPILVQQYRIFAAYLPTYAFLIKIRDVDFYNYINEILALDDDELLVRLEAARELVNNRHNAVVVSAGDKEAIQAAQTNLTEFLAEMPDVEREKTDYSALLLDMEREALVVNSTVQMNLIGYIAEEYTGKMPVVSALLDDMYLLPRLRNGLGAYGAYSLFSKNINLLYAYRDPNLASTYEAFEAIPEYLRTVDLTQEQVDSYIVGSYSSLARPSGALSGAMDAMVDVLVGRTQDVKLQYMKEAKATTVEDIRAYADVIEKMVTNGVRSTSGSYATIQANSDLFDTIIRIDEMETGENAEELPAA